jgi:putative nucleotidyltransferase with HDIG domain
MGEEIPQEVLGIHQALMSAGFEAYFVGGCVRGLLMKHAVEDWDLTTNAKPEQILEVFSSAFYENAFGTVGIPTKERGVVEVTTYRKEGKYIDKRRPASVTWGKTIEEDLSRRDFTINAIALAITTNNGLLATTLIDPFHGRDDIKQAIIRAVGDPNARFQEDALRLLRAIRQATQLAFTIEEKTWRAIVRDSPLIAHISGERIREELLKILTSEHAHDGFMLLNSSGLLDKIIPELAEGKGVSQVRPGRHHKTDVFIHNMLALKFCPSKDPIVLLASLLHDVGKPKSIGKDEEGHVIFYNHEITGAKIALDICERLHFSKKDREKIVNLIRWHMFTVDEKITDSAVRRFIRRVGVQNVKDMMDLRIGDRLGGGTQTAESWRLKLFKKRVEEQLAPAPFSINDLAVDGNDIMKELVIKPGPRVGEILQKLFEEVEENLEKNKREFLLQRIKELG